MSDSINRNGDLTCTDLDEWVDDIADRFEAAWRSLTPPAITPFLGEATGTKRLALLQELIKVDRAYRRRLGETCPVEEYLADFPELRELSEGGDQLRLAMPPTPPARAASTLTPHVSFPGPDGVDGLPHVRGYEILGELGRGGMGIVYRARQIGLNRVVALKMVLAGCYVGSQQRARFRAEVEAAARLQHANIVSIYEVAEEQGQPFCAMEYVAGGTLAQNLDGAPQPHRWAAELVEKLARAAHYAHEHGIVHRDLKPSNILLQTGDCRLETVPPESQPAICNLQSAIPKIADFGLAKHLDGESAYQTQTGEILGTPSYMAPEQADGRVKQIGRAVDVYALGAILYECLTGRPPFRGETTLDTLEQVRTQEPVPPNRFQPKMPRDLSTICLKALAKEPAGRYATAGELADDLGRFLASEPIQARAVGAWERGWRLVQRRPAVAGLLLASGVALLALMGAGIATVAFQATEKARQEAVDARIDAEAQRQLARRYLYGSDMNRAERAWQEAKVAIMVELLERHRPQRAGEPDLRGFEWHYLWHLSHSELPLTLTGHTKPVDAVAFSPDGEHAASAGEDLTVRVWDVRTGRETLTLKGHTDHVKAVAFSPDGRWLASASLDKTIRVWDAQSGEERLTLKRRIAAWGLAFSPDGRQLASTGHDTVNLYDARMGHETKSLKHASAVWGVAFSPDGQRLASSDENGTVKLWDVSGRAPRELQTLRGHTQAVKSVAFSPDGQWLASASRDQTVRLWDARSGQQTLTLKGQAAALYAVAFSPDGHWLASAGQVVELWDARTGQEILTLKGHTSRVSAVAFSPDGQRLVSASRDAAVKVWDWRASDDTLTLKGHTNLVNGVSFSPDGQRVASASCDRTIKVWDVRTGQETLFIKGHTRMVNAVAFSPDGQRLASGSDDWTVKVWDVHTGVETLTLKGHANSVEFLAFSPDGQQLASASQDGTVKLWDACTGEEILTLKGHMNSVWSVAFSPDGQRLASASKDGTVKLWDARTGQLTFTLKADPYEVATVAFSPDGKWLASGGRDYTVKVWDTGTGKQCLILKGHTDPIWCVVFSPDGERLASASGDQSVKIWDVHTGQETLTLKGHTHHVNGVAFSPDGQRLASASYDGTVKIWQTAALTEDEMRQRRAVLIVRDLFETLDFQSEVVAHLRQDRFLPEHLRSEAIALANHQGPDPAQLNDKSRAVVRQTDAPTAARQRAVRQSREACRLVPDNGNYLNTLGIALYRSGQYQAALETLHLSEKLNKADFGAAIPADLAFLVMAQHRLGQNEAAVQSLARLRQAAKEPRWVSDAESQAFVQEAETLLSSRSAPPRK